MGVSLAGKNIKDTLVEIEQCDIEGSASEIKDENVLVLDNIFLVEPVGHCGCGGLVDDSFYLQSGNAPGILGCLPLGLGEIGGNGNHSTSDLPAQVSLGGGLHLGQNESRNLFGTHHAFLPILGDADAGISELVRNDLKGHQFLVFLNRGVGIVSADQALDVVDGVFRVDGGLIQGSIAHQSLVGVGKRNNGRSDAISLVVGNDFSGSIFVHRDTAVGRPEIDADDGALIFLGGWRSGRSECEGHTEQTDKQQKGDWLEG
mmetsp:Transcript_1413/g.2934  ORF Transcript_1413/g.2934 Transcript_1413/m.2934 type:complete len:260 (+) Transcript_1413:610-1389(+)